MIEKKTEDEGQVSETQRLDAQTDPESTPADIEVIPDAGAAGQADGAIRRHTEPSEQTTSTDTDPRDRSSSDSDPRDR